MASEGPEGGARGPGPAVAIFATAPAVPRPRALAPPWRLALVADVARATALMLAWQGVLWLFALLASYAGRPGTAPVTATEFFTRVLLKAEGVLHLAIARQGYDATSAAYPPFFAML